MACAPGVRAADAVTAGANPRYTGSPFVTAWTAEDYGGAPINWHVVFNPVNGFIYVGNNYGVLEFDGAVWRLIELPDHSAVHALAIDSRGRVWAGSAGELCVLMPDDTGALRAVSQRDRLPAAERAIGNLLYALAAPHGVYFASVAQLYFFGDDGTIRTWPAQPRINGLWQMDGALHAAMSDGAVLQLRDGEFAPVDIVAPPNEPGTTPRKRAYAAAPDGAGGWRLLTGFGPSRWAGPGSTLVPFSEESAAPFRGEQTNTAVFLADGRIAYGTVRSGLLVFDRAGRLVQHLTRTDGLPGNRIEKISEDAEGGLWIATHTGIARVQLDSPFAVHGLAQGFAGSPRDVDRLGERLYFTHSEGVSWRGPDGNFHEVSGPRLGMNKLLALDGRMLASGPSLRELRPDDQAPLLLRRSFSPLARWPREPARLIAGGIDGLSLLTHLADGKIREDGIVKNSPLEIRTLLDPGDGWLWGVTAEGRVWRADFRAGLRLEAPIEIFDAARGVPPVRQRDNARLFRLDGQVVAASAAWIRRFDPATNRFVPETRFANPELTAGAVGVATDAAGDLWLRSPPPTQTLFHLAVGPASPWRATPLASAPLAALVANDLYHDVALHTLWLSGQGALVSIDLDWKATHAAPRLRAYVRRLAGSDGVAFHGWSAVPATRADGLAPNPRVEGHPLQLDPKQNSLRFDFAAPAYAPDYRGKLLTVYRTRLEGLDADWTPWSGEPHREFAQLPYRAFVFHVQARALDERTSEPDAGESLVAFVIAPPWWLTRWAYAGYAMLAGLGVVGVVKLRTRGLRRHATVLEDEVAERTRQLHARNQELARLHQLELDEKTSAKLGEQRALLAEEHARLEMLRYQLNPHFLFNALASISGLAVSRPTAARDMIGKLAEFCRTSLTRGRDDTAPLADEFHMLRLYLDVEKTRWEDGLQIDFELEEAVREVRLPSFLLLPLVENAIKYGSQTSADVLKVRVVARRGRDGALEIEVANTGTWVTDGATTAQSTHIGLDNLRERLARAFPGRHTFTTAAHDGWVHVKLTLLLP